MTITTLIQKSRAIAHQIQFVLILGIHGHIVWYLHTSQAVWGLNNI